MPAYLRNGLLRARGLRPSHGLQVTTLGQPTLTVGVISDTHGLLRPEAVEALKGVDHILHAGDVGGPDVLEALSRLAPLAAVRGNTDGGDWARHLPRQEVLELGTVLVALVHDLATLDLDAAAAGVAVVVFGHSHKPVAEHRRGVLYMNPGSAGPRRFALPTSVGFLRISPLGVSGEIRYLTC